MFASSPVKLGMNASDSLFFKYLAPPPQPIHNPPSSSSTVELMMAARDVSRIRQNDFLIRLSPPPSVPTQRLPSSSTQSDRMPSCDRPSTREIRAAFPSALNQ